MDASPIYARKTGLPAKLAVCLAIVTMFLAVGSTIQVDKSSAATGSDCTYNSPNWACLWYDSNLAPSTRDWFSAANTLRDWKYAAVNDATNSVNRKCVGIKRSSDGNISHVACTHNGGAPDSFIGTGRRPGWLFTVHWAAGPRYIIGDGYH